MIARWNKALAALAACATIVGGLSACGSMTNADGQAEKMTLVVWGSQEDQLNEDSWLQEMERAFQKEHPEYDITWKNQVVASADASNLAKQDPTVAADVYSYASDQLGTLLDANAIGQVSDPTMKQLKRQTKGSPTMLQTVTGEDGNVYGVPLAGNTWFMYYRKSKFTEQDITSLDAMLAKGKVSFPLTNSWYLPAFYMGAGGTLFGEDGTDAKSGVQFGGETGAEVTRYLVTCATTRTSSTTRTAPAWRVSNPGRWMWCSPATGMPPSCAKPWATTGAWPSCPPSTSTASPCR